MYVYFRLVKARKGERDLFVGDVLREKAYQIIGKTKVMWWNIGA